MQNEREKYIYSILQEKGNVTVEELSKTLFVSEMTIRRDLSKMEKEGYLERYRGGAVPISEDIALPINQRVHVAEDEKKRLAKLAVKYLHNDMTIFIDSSSTCLYLIRYLKEFSNITVFTNSLKAISLLSKMHIESILIGGRLYEKDLCFVGSEAEYFVDHINVDVAFCSIGAVSSDMKLSDTEIEQLMIRKRIAKNSGKCLFLCEKSKQNKKLKYIFPNENNNIEIIL